MLENCSIAIQPYNSIPKYIPRLSRNPNQVNFQDESHGASIGVASISRTPHRSQERQTVFSQINREKARNKKGTRKGRNVVSFFIRNERNAC